MSESPNESNEPPMTDLPVPWRDVVGFVRQLSHDLRNHLNAAELQSAFVNELASDPELKSEVQRLRGMISEMGGSLQRLTNFLVPIKLTRMPYEAKAFVEDLEQKLAAQFPAQSTAIDWEVQAAGELLDIDPQLLQQAFLELFANAFQHDRALGQLAVSLKIENGECVIALREPKDGFTGSTEHWGQEPFHKVMHGHYGLGLYRVRNIIEAHEGRFQVRHDQSTSTLLTTVTLPLAAAE